MDNSSPSWREWIDERLRPEQRRAVQFVAALFTASTFIASDASNLQWATGPVLWLCRTSQIVCFVILILTALYVYLQNKPLPGVDSDQPSTFLSRKTQLRALKKKLEATSSGLLVITGESGTGKSTLVHPLLTKLLKAEGSGWRTEIVSTFRNIEDFKDEITNRLKTLGAPLQDEILGEEVSATIPIDLGPSLLIFDQFEHFLNAMLHEPELKLDEFFNAVAQYWIDGGNRRYCILILRKEAFLDLSFLDRKGARIFENMYRLDPVQFRRVNDQRDADVKEAMKWLKEVVDTETSTAIENDLCAQLEVLPLEVDLLAKTLAELKQKTGMKISLDQYNKLGKHSGLIRDVFLHAINSSKDKEAATSVLYALSCSGAARYLKLKQIVRATHRQSRTVRAVLDSFTKGSLRLVKCERDYIDCMVAHDYIAREFENLSERLLPAGYRANVRHFTELVLSGKDEIYVESLTLNEEEPMFSLLNIVFAVIALGLVVRLFYGWAPLDRAWIDPSASPRGRVVDWRYFPSFIASMACAFYCWQFFRNFLFKISMSREPTKTRRITLGTVTTALVVCAMIFMGTLIPHLWLVFACIAGIFIGIRLWVLYLRLPNRVYSGNMFRGVIKGYFAFLVPICVLIGCLGLGALRYCHLLSIGKLKPINQTYGFAAETLLAILMLAYMGASWWGHASRRQSSVMLSEWDRMKVP